MPELNDADKALLEKIVGRHQAAQDHRKPYEDRWDRFYRQYVLYNAFKSAWKDAPDRDAIIWDAKREWGANLKTPWAFATVETLVPRMVAHRPRMLVLPRSKLATPGVDVDDNAENMRFLVDAQQEQIQYDLKLETTAKTGLIYGLGVQKSAWRYEECVERELSKGILGWRPKERRRVKFDDPDVENLDIWDWFWDPYAAEARAMEWALQRAWRSTRYVLEKLQTSWVYPAAPTEEEVRGRGSAAAYTEARQARMSAEGVHSGWQPSDDDIHEVWEFHDGREVVTVLDREWIVQRGPNPYWHGELPFYCFRPSERPGTFVGTGVIEPIEHLIMEMDTLRSQRRDNATLNLNSPFFYNEGLLDTEDVIWGPGVGIPVNGDPNEVIKQAQVRDVPNSGYQEEAALKADIERATGISDAVSGVGGADLTATGVQLRQQAASERTKLMIRRMERELIVPCTRHFGRMNQQKIRANKEVRIPALPTPDEPERRWAWRELSPGELLGEFEYVCEGGSTEPENIAQQRQDATMLLNTVGKHPQVDQRKLLPRVLELMGIERPEEFLMPDDRISVRILDKLKQRMVGSPDVDDDAPLLLNSPEGPREAHPQEADELIEMMVQELEQEEMAEQEAQQSGMQPPQQQQEEVAA